MLSNSGAVHAAFDLARGAQDAVKDSMLFTRFSSDQHWTA
jgi:hypothetical protein